MRRAFTNIVAAGGVLAWAATTATGQEEAPAVPSGIVLTLQEVRRDAGAAGMIRFRYIAPAIAEAGFAAVEADFPVLCETQVLTWLSMQPEPAERVVISMSERAVPFGEAVPDVVQFFEVFRLEGAACIWEGL
ncbi:MAG: DUF6497 family protein [Pseudooceanicola sp.]